jgi:hypothetical protein
VRAQFGTDFGIGLGGCLNGDEAEGDAQCGHACQFIIARL